MFYKYLKFLIQVIIVFSLYYMLSDYLSDAWIVTAIIALALTFVLFGYLGRKSYMFDLEVMCNVQKYLDNVNTKLGNKDETYLMLYKSYGNIFNGDFSTIEMDIHKIDRKKLKINEKFMLDEINLKIAYNNNDRESYNSLLEEMNKTYQDKIYTSELNAFEVPLYLMDEKYEEVIGILFKEITNQKKRLRIIELEYYLILAYLAMDNEDDAVAVLEFIVERNYKLDYTEKCKVLLDKITEE